MYNLLGEVISSIHLMEAARLFLLVGGCIFLYFGGLLFSKYKGNNKPMKINLWIFFCLYLILLITLILFDTMWGRGGLIFELNLNFLTYLKNSINLIPFKIISEFIKQFESIYSSRTILLNLFGNFIALMPFSFFLLILLKNKQNLKTLY